MVGITTGKEEVVIRRQRPARYIQHPSAASSVRTHPHLFQDHISTREVVVTVTATVVTEDKIIPRRWAGDINCSARLVDRPSPIKPDDQTLGGTDRQRVAILHFHQTTIVRVITQKDCRWGDTSATSKVHLARVDLHRSGEGVGRRQA